MKKAFIAFTTLVVLLCVNLGSASAETVLNNTVDKYLGIKYKTAGSSTSGFDCSGFTVFIFKQFDIDLPRQSSTQALEGDKVARSDLKPGDLVFFNTNGKSISHVGIYLGDDEFIHSASNKGVSKNKLSEKYYDSRYVTARRVLSEDQFTQLTQAVN